MTLLTLSILSTTLNGPTEIIEDFRAVKEEQAHHLRVNANIAACCRSSAKTFPIATDLASSRNTPEPFSLPFTTNSSTSPWDGTRQSTLSRDVSFLSEGKVTHGTKVALVMSTTSFTCSFGEAAHFEIRGSTCLSSPKKSSN